MQGFWQEPLLVDGVDICRFSFLLSAFLASATSSKPSSPQLGVGHGAFSPVPSPPSEVVSPRGPEDPLETTVSVRDRVATRRPKSHAGHNDNDSVERKEMYTPWILGHVSLKCREYALPLFMTAGARTSPCGMKPNFFFPLSQCFSR